jgi:hypothetical protein
MRREKNYILIQIVTLKIHAFFHMLSEKVHLQHRILGFANGTTANTNNDKSVEPLADSFFHIHISLTFVTNKLLSQIQKTEVTWCQNPTHPARQPHCNNLYESASKHSLYSHNFVSNDFHLSGPLKKHLSGHMLQDAVEVQEAVTLVLFTKPRISVQEI